jgi:hypothetical protein
VSQGIAVHHCKSLKRNGNVCDMMRQGLVGPKCKKCLI